MCAQEYLTWSMILMYGGDFFGVQKFAESPRIHEFLEPWLKVKFSSFEQAYHTAEQAVFMNTTEATLCCHHDPGNRRDARRSSMKIPSLVAVKEMSKCRLLQQMWGWTEVKHVPIMTSQLRMPAKAQLTGDETHGQWRYRATGP